MRDKPKAPRRKPKPLARMMDARGVGGAATRGQGDARHASPAQPEFDQKKSARSTRQANQAADRLLREMDAFLKNADRKP